MAYLDNNGVLYLWGKIKSYVSTAINAIFIPSKTSELTNDSGFITSDDVPEGAAASTTTPKMDGTAAVGSETAFARGDHRHPTDTSRASASDLTSHTGNTTVHITSTERTSWNGKYAKPSGGIPKTDLASAVQTSLGKADTALQEHQDISGKVDKVDGKGLSTNDFTTAEKNKLQGIEAGADANPVFRRSATATAEKVTGFDVVTDGAYQGVNIVCGDGSTHFLIDSSGFATAMQQIASTYALKSDIASMYKYRGSVATVSALPSSDNTTGDVYNVESTGMNYAWDGTAWDALGESFQITAITNAELDSICT